MQSAAPSMIAVCTSWPQAWATPGSRYYLGRYDVLCTRASADFGIDWRNVEDPPSGEKPFFWVAHAAAVNIGSRDSPEVEDFRSVQGGVQVLHEQRYIQAMGKIIRSVVAACSASPNICHCVFFPFGMGGGGVHEGAPEAVSQV